MVLFFQMYLKVLYAVSFSLYTSANTQKNYKNKNVSLLKTNLHASGDVDKVKEG